MFAYIHCRTDEKKFSARMMCAVLPVSESGFYKWERNRGTEKSTNFHGVINDDIKNGEVSYIDSVVRMSSKF